LERRYQITSESVTEGHPDKISDQISDAILDAILAQDPRGRVAVETLVATGLILIAGQVSTNSYVDIPHVARSTVRDIGYTRAKYGFDFETCAVLTAIDEQSPDIALGVNRSLEVKMGEEVEDEELSLGAGDQGMMYGYACNETPELMPFPIVLAHRLAFRLAEVRKKGILPYLRPDGKTQVTVDYVDDKPVRVDNIVISAQHHPDISLDTLREDIWREVIDPVVPRSYRDNGTQVLVNPTGRLLLGGHKETLVLREEKSLLIPMEGLVNTEEGAFLVKIPLK